jgi:molybdopterin-binding protein
MTEPVLQLDDFALTDLHVHWEPREVVEGEVTSQVTVDYAVRRLTSDPTHYRLDMTVKDRRLAATGEAFANIEATIVGFFSFPSGTEANEREKRIRINGLTVLYGALRGALANVCGVFPPDFRYVLPTVNMLDVIRTVETNRSKAAGAEVKPSSVRRAPTGQPRVRPSRPRKSA